MEALPNGSSSESEVREIEVSNRLMYASDRCSDLSNDSTEIGQANDYQLSNAKLSDAKPSDSKLSDSQLSDSQP